MRDSQGERASLMAPSGRGRSGGRWTEFSAYLSEHSESIVLVLGAGIHRLWKVNRAEPADAARLLSSWDALLREVAGGDAVGPSPLVQWEMAVASEFSGVASGVAQGFANAPALVRERALQSVLCTRVKSSEDVLFNAEGGGMEVLTRLLRSPRVSDVLSLNFDLTVERLASDAPGIIPRASGDERLRVIRRGDTAPLRVWHPHGDRALARSIRLGVRHYFASVKRVDQAFGRFKAQERANGFGARSGTLEHWIDPFLTSPVVFVGTSLDASEWDLWYALSMRWRNHARARNLRYEQPVWSLGAATAPAPQPGRIRRLEGRTWGEAWSLLGEVIGA